MGMDLSTSYMGLSLKHPIVASASPLSSNLDGIRRLEDGGVSAIVMSSLFEEQIRLSSRADVHYARLGCDQHAEVGAYFHSIEESENEADHYLELIRRATDSLSVPLIASLNGTTRQGWMEYAARIEAAGASGLELNIHPVNTRFDEDAAAIEAEYLAIVSTIKSSLRIPVAVKLSPFFTAMGAMARCLDEKGIDALVLFNRFYQPDYDLDRLEVIPTIDLSSKREIRLPLLWSALLHGRVRASLATTTGVETSDEVIKYLLAGADVVMTTSALLRNGPQYARVLLNGLEAWMKGRGFTSIRDVRGLLSHERVEDPSLIERSNYLNVLSHYRLSDPS